MSGKSSTSTELTRERRAQRTVQFYVRRLKSQLEELTVRTYPGWRGGAREVLSLIGGVLDTAEERLAEAHSQSDGSTIRRLVKDAIELARLAYNDMELMRGSDVSELDHSVVQPMQRWFEGIDPPRTIFFRAENVVNYEIRPIKENRYRGITDPSNRLSTAIAAIDWPLTRVTVPSRALGILPHFAVVAHEFGHIIYSDFISGISDKFSQNAGTLKGVYDSFSDRIESRIGKNLSDKNIRKLVNIFLGNWTEEIACDAIAFALTGPASFFALSDILQFGSANFIFNHTHPPKVLRRKFLYKLMSRDENNFLEIFNIYAKESAQEDFNSIFMLELPHADNLYKEFKNRKLEDAHAAVLAELPGIIIHQGPLICEAILEGFLKDTAKADEIYTVDQYKIDLETHLASLLQAIPPIETGVKLAEKQPSDFAAILNVGWVALLCKLDEFEIDTGDEPDHLRAPRKIPVPRLDRLESGRFDA